MKKKWKVLKVLESSSDPLCYHQIADLVGMEERLVSPILSHLERTGFVSRTFERGVCNSSSFPHYFYNYKPKKAGRIIDMDLKAVDEKKEKRKPVDVSVLVDSWFKHNHVLNNPQWMSIKDMIEVMK